MSNTAKWVISAVCGVLGVIALIYAVIYLATPIHSLPGFVPGKVAVNGHYHKRALLCAVIGVVLVAIAVFLGVTARRETAQVGAAPGAGSAAAPGVADPPGDTE